MAIETAAVPVQSALVTLGRFELWVDSRPAPPPPTHKARALAAFLVSQQGRDIARERLLELFWNDFEPERAREGLRTALSSIRHSLRSTQQHADELLFADKSIVRWIGDTGFDVNRFEELSRSKDVAGKRAALRMYGGDFLEGNYEEWAVGERERIASIYESLLAALVAQQADADAARLLLARNPFHEEAYAILIDSQLQANRPAAAAELIAQYRGVMEELGAQPSAEFRERFAQVKEVDTIARAASRVERAKVPTAQVTSTPTNLPLQLTSFVGRNRDVAEIKTLVRRSRLVTVTGAGGIGKTRLAIEAAEQLRPAFDDGAWFIDLGAVSDPVYVASAIAPVVGVSNASADRPLQDALLAALQNRTMLLVFDNCEHIAAASARIAESLLQTCAGIRILATSREPLNIGGEEVVRLATLAGDDALTLFTERATSADKRFTLSEGNETIVQAICKRLDNIPLAIELAASRAGAVSLKRLQSELDAHFRILASGSSTVLPRHKTVRALVDWSYDLLSQPEQAMLRRSGVFVGGFTLRAAEALFAQDFPECDVLDLVSSLVTKSLILLEPDPERERYRLLQTTQRYAADKLREADELTIVRKRYAQYFLQLMEEADQTYGAANAREWLHRYQPEIDNIRAAIDYSLESGDVFTGAALTCTASALWQDLGLYAEAMRRAKHALEVLPEDAPLELRAGLWLVLGQASNALYLWPQALDAAQRARDGFEAIGDERHLAYASQSVGCALTRGGISEDAELALQRAQELAERQGNRRLLMRAVLRRAQNVYSGRSLEQSLPLYEQALQLAHILQDDLYEGYIVGLMADAYFALGEPVHSISLADAARVIFERRRDASQEAVSLSNLAAYHLVMGNLAASKECARRSLVRAREAESPVNVAAAVQHLGALSVLQGQLQTGSLLLGFADQAFTRLYFSRTRTECATREKAMEVLREKLAGAELESLLEDGAALSSDEAFTLAFSA